MTRPARLLPVLCLTAAAALMWAAPAAAVCRSRVAAAGDMNHLAEARATGALAERQAPAVVVTLGDHVYSPPTLEAFRRDYEPTGWGRLRPLDHPVPGHHEYRPPGPAGYHRYFGVPAGYAYDAGCGWRGYALDSVRDVAGQLAFLRQDLSAHPRSAVLAAWSDPRRSSGTRHGSEPAVQPFLDALARRRGVVLNGHEHQYERFAVAGGLRQFVVGTAGTASYPFGVPQPGSEVRLTGVPGVLALDLAPAGSYSWRFVDVHGRVHDSGTH